MWFAGNAVIADIITALGLNPSALGHTISAVQLGFISGTLLSAILTIPDRFSPSKVFFICAVAGAIANTGIMFSTGLGEILSSRFITGLCLAGIYPVGMKIASDYFKEGLGIALGFLVGALVLGTALPHLIKSLTAGLPWKYVILSTSGLSIFGGILIFNLVPDGPNRTKAGKINLGVFFTLFKNKTFRQAAFGYFGHMWELYAFWAFLQVFTTGYYLHNHDFVIQPSLLSFFIIGSGAIGCVIGGFIAKKKGSAYTAFIALFFSFCCCILSPLIFRLPLFAFTAILMFWGFMASMDSPQFSTLAANAVIGQYKGTALTIVTCIGFAITIASIQLLNLLSGLIDSNYIFLFLAPGPLLGLLGMRKLLNPLT